MRVFELTPQGIFYAVRNAAQRAELPEIRPHDLRRTFAKLSRAGGAPLEQISAVLGHASLRTTERYLGTTLELREGKAAPDFIRLEDEDQHANSNER